MPLLIQDTTFLEIGWQQLYIPVNKQETNNFLYFKWGEKSKNKIKTNKKHDFKMLDSKEAS